MKDMKLKLFRLGFTISAVLLFGFVFFTWVTIQIGDLVFSISDFIGVVGTLIFGVLSVVFLRKYYQVKKHIKR